MAEQRLPNETQAFALLEKYAEKTRQFTINDAASVTGVPLLESEYAIKSLMEKYEVKLKVTENGDLIYDFASMHRRNAKSFLEYFQDAMDWLWKIFTYVYKFTISIVLVLYFVIFVVLIIALAIAASAANKDDNNNNNSSGLLGNLMAMIFRTFLEIFMWNRFYAPSVYYTTDRHGYSYPHYNNNPSAFNRKNDGKKGFIASIYDFVFGPKRVEADPLANKQEVASFLRKHNGIIVTPELQALAGWNRDEADKFMTECLAHFDGRAEVSSNATLYGDYIELVRSANRTGEAPIVYYWDEYEAPHELTGNTNTYNIIIIIMNIFNFAMSSLIIFDLIKIKIGEQLIDLSSIAFLGWIPFIYSALFFLIPLFRWIGISRKNKAQHEHNIRKRLMKVIFQSSTPIISLKTLMKAANQRKKGEEELTEEAIKSIMKDLVYDLKGELIIDPHTAELKYNFSELDRELSDAEIIRADKNRDNNIGNIIMEA